jgi:hypothetical protein
MQELQAVLSSLKDSAPGLDAISYILQHLPSKMAMPSSYIYLTVCGLLATTPPLGKIYLLNPFLNLANYQMTITPIDLLL